MVYNHNFKTEEGIGMLRQVREICSSLPETEEIIDGFGHTTFKVCGKSFIIIGEDETGAGLSFKSDKETQGMLILEDRYYKTTYIGQHGWVSTDRVHGADWEELGSLLKEAYLPEPPNAY